MLSVRKVAVVSVLSWSTSAGAWQGWSVIGSAVIALFAAASVWRITVFGEKQEQLHGALQKQLTSRNWICPIVSVYI